MSLNLKKLFSQNSEKNLGFVTEATNLEFDAGEVFKKAKDLKKKGWSASVSPDKDGIKFNLKKTW